MLLSCSQNAGQNLNKKISNTAITNVAKFRYFRVTVTYRKLVREEIKRRLNSGNACYNLSSYLLSKYT
jgi:hypothetical protein